MAQIYVFGRVMHELTPKESQSKQPYVCFDLVERKRQIKGRVDRYEKIVVERIEMFHHY